MILVEQLTSLGLVYTWPSSYKVSATTMESLLLKVLDFGLQIPTGPSSGVVASFLFVSPKLDCSEVSLVEVCATCLRCHL